MTTAEELASRHTRRELEEMAEKFGIETIGIGTKVHLAEALIRAEESARAKEKPKVEAPKVAASAKIEKKGVFAKRAAMDMQIKENEMAAEMMGAGVKELQNNIEEMRSAMDEKTREMLKEGAAELRKGIHEMQKGVDTQIKENERAAAKMDTGIKKVQKGIDEFGAEIREFRNETANYIKDFYYG